MVAKIYGSLRNPIAIKDGHWCCCKMAQAINLRAVRPNGDPFVYVSIRAIETNTSMPSDADMCQSTVSSLVQVMACRLNQFSLIVNCTLWNMRQFNFVSSYNTFQSPKYIWKYRPFESGHVVGPKTYSHQLLQSSDHKVFLSVRARTALSINTVGLGIRCINH